MESTFESQCREYQRQQTEAGSRAQAALDKMAANMQKVTKHPIRSGRLYPLVEGKTGKITQFYER